MKKAFTLIELLVVIGILGILIGTLVVSFGSSTESARTVKCAANMKNLAAAAIAEGYPFAQSCQYPDTDRSRQGSGGKGQNGGGGGLVYKAHRGWISYLDMNTKYPLASPGSFQQCSFASPNAEEKLHALTNGAIWKALGGSRDSYRCPAFVRACQNAGVTDPGWSYQMNAYFGYEQESGKALSTKNDGVSHPSRADRRLLFAEIPALELKPSDASKSGVNQLPPVNLTGGNGTPECDGCLTYRSTDGSGGKGQNGASGGESIGFNHRRSRQIVGHVAFADGHVETIIAPKNGNYLDLTAWLCEARDVIYQNGSYEDIKGSVTE